MDFKRISAAGLALTLAAGLTGPVLASDIPAGWTPADGARMPQLISAPAGDRYLAQVAVNGVELDSVSYENVDPVTYETTEVTMTMADLPWAPAGYVPARLLCAADSTNGYTSWLAEENSAIFALHKTSFVVYFDDLRIEVAGQAAEGQKAYLSQGVTFLPVSFLASLPNVEVDDHPEMDSARYDVKLVVTPLEALVNTIKAETGCGANFEFSADDLRDMLGIPTEDMEQVVAYGPMMTSPDTIIIAQVPADKQAPVLEGFEAYRAGQEETFSWYLTQHLEKTQKAQILAQGDYVMLFIGENEAKAAELFAAGVKEL